MKTKKLRIKQGKELIGINYGEVYEKRTEKKMLVSYFIAEPNLYYIVTLQSKFITGIKLNKRSRVTVDSDGNVEAIPETL